MTRLLDADEARQVWLAMPKQVRAAVVRRAREGTPFPDPEWTRLALAQVRRDRRVVQVVRSVSWVGLFGVWLGMGLTVTYFGGHVQDAPLWFGVSMFVVFAGVFATSGDRLFALFGTLGLTSGLPVDAERRWREELGLPVVEPGPLISRWRTVLVVSMLALLTAVVLVGLLDYEPDPVGGLWVLAFVGAGHLLFWLCGWFIAWLRRRLRRAERGGQRVTPRGADRVNRRQQGGP